jgi:hypothetical protein
MKSLLKFIIIFFSLLWAALLLAQEIIYPVRLENGVRVYYHWGEYNPMMNLMTETAYDDEIATIFNTSVGVAGGGLYLADSPFGSQSYVNANRTSVFHGSTFKHHGGVLVEVHIPESVEVEKTSFKDNGLSWYKTTGINGITFHPFKTKGKPPGFAEEAKRNLTVLNAISFFDHAVKQSEMIELFANFLQRRFVRINHKAPTHVDSDIVDLFEVENHCLFTSKLNNVYLINTLKTFFLNHLPEIIEKAMEPHKTLDHILKKLDLTKKEWVKKKVEGLIKQSLIKKQESSDFPIHFINTDLPN